jgi:hypothetical protein
MFNKRLAVMVVAVAMTMISVWARWVLWVTSIVAEFNDRIKP